MSNNNSKLLCDVATFYPQPFISKALCKSVFDSFYSLSNPSIESSIKLVIDADVIGQVWMNL